MATKFEDAVAALKAQHYESPEMLQVLQLISEQNERIKNLEAGNLANKHAVSELDAASKSHGRNRRKAGARPQEGRGTRQARHRRRGRGWLQDLEAGRSAEAGRGEGRSDQARGRVEVDPADFHATEDRAGNDPGLTRAKAAVGQLLLVSLGNGRLDPG